MADERDLTLNTLDRFRKSSSRLALEEHSHCEVPAGCGGVVLRWINAERDMPVELLLYAPGGAELTLDGVAPASTRMLVARGDHVIGLRVKPSHGGAAFLFALDESLKSRRDAMPAPRLRCVSADDGAWLGTATAPVGETWRDDPFDDRAWKPLARAPLARPGGKDWGNQHKYDELLRRDAVPLGLPGARGTVWARRRLRIPLVGEGAR